LWENFIFYSDKHKQRRNDLHMQNAQFQQLQQVVRIVTSTFPCVKQCTWRHPAWQQDDWTVWRNWRHIG